MVMGLSDVEKHLGVEVYDGKYKKYENVFVYQKVEDTQIPANNGDYKSKQEIA